MSPSTLFASPDSSRRLQRHSKAPNVITRSRGIDEHANDVDAQDNVDLPNSSEDAESLRRRKPTKRDAGSAGMLSSPPPNRVTPSVVSLDISHSSVVSDDASAFRSRRRRRVSSRSDISGVHDLSDGGSLPSSAGSSLPVSPRQHNHSGAAAPRRRSNAADGSGDGPRYRCSECGSPFSRLEHLKRHLVKHTGERNFACNICGKTFSRSDNCKQHMRKHVGADVNDITRLQPVVLSSGNKASMLLTSKNSIILARPDTDVSKTSKSGDVSGRVKAGASVKTASKGSEQSEVTSGNHSQLSMSLRTGRRSRNGHEDTYVDRRKSYPRRRKIEEEEETSEEEDDDEDDDEEEDEEQEEKDEVDSVGNTEEDDDREEHVEDRQDDVETKPKTLFSAQDDDATDESHADDDGDTCDSDLSGDIRHRSSAAFSDRNSSMSPASVPLVPSMPTSRIARVAPEVPDLDSTLKSGPELSWSLHKMNASCNKEPLRFDWASAGPSCVTCGLVFGNVDSLVSHLTNDHLPDLSDTSSPVPTGPLGKLKRGDLVNACPMSPLPEVDVCSELSETDASSFSSCCSGRFLSGNSCKSGISLGSSWSSSEVETDDPLGIRALAVHCELGVETSAERLVVETIGPEPKWDLN